MKFPVRNWTFDGIFEELMDFAQNQDMMELPIPYDRFGWFYPVSTYDFFNVPKKLILITFLILEKR